jgi:penicillin-binding protein 2
MPQRIEERLPAITPQLAWRVAVLGGLAFVLFGIVFFRLWFLQVLSGQDYVSQAAQNRVRKVRIEAPRGDIVDRNGTVLVKTRVAPVVQLLPSALPASVQREADAYRRALSAAETARLQAADRLQAIQRQLRGRKHRSKRQQARLHRLRKAADTARPVAVPAVPASETRLKALYHRLSRVIGLRPRVIHERVIRGLADAPYSNVTVRSAVSRDAFDYLRERAEDFPGVVVEKQYLRDYPHGKLAAQLFGTVSEITQPELKERRYRGVAPGTRVGQSGIEEAYDRYLRGTDGYYRIVINALGERDDRRLMTRVEPRQGQRLKLSLDLGLERAANSAMARAIAAASQNGARAGAYVAMDPRDGQVLALGSYPSFDANVFAKPLSQRTYDSLTSEANGAPLLNRAIASAYPTGSTFKPITALASLEAGIITPSTPINDPGYFQLGTQRYVNARGAVNGTLTLPDALKVSSDVFFYTLGADANPKGPIIQRWAHKLGFGRRTGIDVPGETKGLVPDRAWRDAGYQAYLKCANKANVTPGTSAALFKCGGIERPWTAGDNVNLAVGQGDLQATPLQLATAYSAIVDGGRVPRPHLGMAVEDGLGRTVEEIHTPARRHVQIDPSYRAAIMEGLHRATSSKGGTSADVFAGFPRTVYGKTGTAERGLDPDQAWYACYVPDKSRPIVVVTTIERGGFGAETAAPAARLILDEWFHLGDNQFHAGTSATR